MVFDNAFANTMYLVRLSSVGHMPLLAHGADPLGRKRFGYKTFSEKKVSIIAYSFLD